MCIVLRIFLVVTLFAPIAPALAREDSKPNGWLLHLPGMGGLMNIDRNVTGGILRGGFDAKLEIYDWTGVDRGLVALANVKRHETQAAIVAQMIEKHLREHPDEHTTIVSHSAGTGIAVFALERLPNDVMIDDLVMIASALSPNYDLSRALRHVRHKAYAFNSELDVIVLGTGTKMFGTVDREKVDAAGRVGFAKPKAADDQQYAKLEQIPYEPDWMRFGNNGEHIGAMTYSFARNVIAAVLLGKGIPPPAATEPTTKAAQ